MRLNVIIPCHNVEELLAECLVSVLDQECDGVDLRVVAVDDASPDGCGQILDDVAATDPRVSVVHLEENVGLGGARNVAIERVLAEPASEGGHDYIAFLDGDDRLAPGSVAAVRRALEEVGWAELAVLDYERFWPARTSRNPKSGLLRELASRPFTAIGYPEILDQQQVAWNKVAHRGLVERTGLRFPGGLYEDIPWTYTLLLKARTIVTVPGGTVEYRQRPSGSILSTQTTRHTEALGQWQRVFDTVAADDTLRRWRAPLVHRAVDHYTHILVTPGRLDGDERHRFAADAAAQLNEQSAGVSLAAKGHKAHLKALALIRGELRAVDALQGAQRVAQQAAPHVRDPKKGAKTVAREARRQAKRARGRARTGGNLAWYRLQLRRPLDPGLVLCCTLWDRKPGGNPLAVAEAMRTVAPHLRAVWYVGQDAVKDMPPGAAYVVKGSRESFEALARATYTVNDVNYPDYVVKREGQVHVQTHHGTPLKHMGMDLRDYPLARKGMDLEKLQVRNDRWDYSITSNSYSTRVWASAYPSAYRRLEAGYPRNDVLVNATADDVRAARDELGLRPGQRAVLYAPTFRDKERSLQVKLDLEMLAEALGEGGVVLLRGHYWYDRQQGASSDAITRLVEAGRLRDVSLFPSVERLMLAADALVTDYSSIMFDYANLDRPIALFIPDWDDYVETRGVYFDLPSEPPGVVACTNKELAEAFSSGAYDSEEAAALRLAFRRTFTEFDDGRAAERVARVVFRGEEPLPITPIAERTPPPRPSDHR